MPQNRSITLGVIVGNRDFFPDALVTQGRQDILEVLAERGIEAVILDEQSTKLGGVETWQDAKKCAALFDEHRQRINGILVVLPNFGDEKGVADTIKLSGLNVPILVQAYPDDLTRFSLQRRRDAFCGKISVCNNLYQYGIPFSVTKRHTVLPKSDAFKADLDEFVAVCRVVDGMKRRDSAPLVLDPTLSTRLATVKSFCRPLASALAASICLRFLAEQRKLAIKINQ